jgi:transcriptional antiterminator RfaH
MNASVRKFELDQCARRLNWFAAQLKPNGLSLAQRNLDRQGFKHFVPMRRETRRMQKGLQSVKRPLFPGYIFVFFNPESSAWRRLNSTRGISRLILSDPRRPRPLPDEFMLALQERCGADEIIRDPDAFVPGERVRILDGPFAQIVAQVDGMSSDQRLRLLLSLMSQTVRIELPALNVERLP